MGTTKRTAAAVLGAGALLAATACGRLTGGGAEDGRMSHPMGPHQLVLRVNRGGGFMPLEGGLGELPAISLMGDGTLVTEGPQIQIYPQPALPNLLVRPLTEEGVQAILSAAGEAGLLRDLGDLGRPAVADAATTTYTVVAEGETHVTRVYALEAGLQDDPQLEPEQQSARERLLEFERKLGDLERWLPPGSVGEERAFEFDELRVYVLDELEVPPEKGIEQKVLDWPLDTPLAEFGAALRDLPRVRCGSVEGEDLDLLAERAGQANKLTRWRSGGEDFYLVFRPLLPDESGCPESLAPGG